jgi:hypothetical protein
MWTIEPKRLGNYTILAKSFRLKGTLPVSAPYREAKNFLGGEQEILRITEM